MRIARTNLRVPSSRLLRVMIGMAVAMALSLVAVGNAFSDEERVRFTMRDDCDPATFDAAVGPGTCIQRGSTTFGDFIADLIEDHFVAAWRFDPRRAPVHQGRSIELKNRGGETHTFTKVAKFGGGFVPPLNGLTAPILETPVAPECVSAPGVPAPPSPTNIFVPAGQEVDGPMAGTSALPLGQSKWQCCIHPWMRTTITVP